MNSPADQCPNCGAIALQAFCSACGEKRLDRAEWHLRNVAGEVFSEVTDVEGSKVWQTLRFLVFKPGQLTRDHWAGKRRRYLGPVKLYLIVFAVSVVLYSIHAPTAVYDVRSMAAADHTGGTTARLQEVVNETGLTSDQAAEAVNNRWHSYISASQLLYPLIIALALKLLFIRRGRYFAEHLIFSLHLLAFITLTFLLLWPLYFLAAMVEARQFDLRSPFYMALTVGSVIWVAVYVLLALRRAYEQTWTWAIVKGVLVFLVYFVSSMIIMLVTLTSAIEAAMP
jgi:hypothetical protein